MKTDVAIIGAGPAGSVLGSLLTRRGVTVALIDRDTFPRDKLCGEFLSYDALPVLEQLGLAGQLDAHGAPRIDQCVVVGRKRRYEFRLPRPARGVSRLLLDDLLLRNAIASGAQALTGWTATVVKPAHEGRPAGINIERRDEQRVIEAKVLVGAWGRWGRFDTQLERGFVRDRSHRNFGFKRHYRSSVALPATIELYSFRRGYLGASAIEGGLTNICGLVHASRLSNHKGRWDSFIESIRDEEPQLERLYSQHEPAQDGFLSSEPVIFRARSPVEQGVFMIGDASGVIDPLTGNGMAMAIQSALLAAPFIIRRLQTANPSNEENGYRKAHADFFGGRIAWSRRVAFLLSRPALLEAAMATVRTRSVGEFFLRRTRAGERSLSRLLAERF